MESFRDERGKPAQRVVATLGRVEELRAGQSNSLINGLLRAAGHPDLEEGTAQISFGPALSVGDTWLLHALWAQLGFDAAFRCILRSHR